ncbi:hypothetical protein H9P43_003136 [Blastocladiella emersonii ATCC 22665]|nr:hypothetical protein H9P43_003136 [Blastocladiella emersonii ATCC 22665]
MHRAAGQRHSSMSLPSSGGAPGPFRSSSVGSSMSATGSAGIAVDDDPFAVLVKQAEPSARAAAEASAYVNAASAAAAAAAAAAFEPASPYRGLPAGSAPRPSANAAANRNRWSTMSAPTWLDAPGLSEDPDADEFDPYAPADAETEYGGGGPIAASSSAAPYYDDDMTRSEVDAAEEFERRMAELRAQLAAWERNFPATADPVPSTSSPTMSVTAASRASGNRNSSSSLKLHPYRPHEPSYYHDHPRYHQHHPSHHRYLSQYEQQPYPQQQQQQPFRGGDRGGSHGRAFTAEDLSAHGGRVRRERPVSCPPISFSDLPSNNNNNPFATAASDSYDAHHRASGFPTGAGNRTSWSSPAVSPSLRHPLAQEWRPPLPNQWSANCLDDLDFLASHPAALAGAPAAADDGYGDDDDGDNLINLARDGPPSPTHSVRSLAQELAGAMGVAPPPPMDGVLISPLGDEFPDRPEDLAESDAYRYPHPNSVYGDDDDEEDDEYVDEADDVYPGSEWDRGTTDSLVAHRTVLDPETVVTTYSYPTPPAPAPSSKAARRASYMSSASSVASSRHTSAALASGAHHLPSRRSSALMGGGGAGRPHSFSFGSTSAPSIAPSATSAASLAARRRSTNPFLRDAPHRASVSFHTDADVVVAHPVMSAFDEHLAAHSVDAWMPPPPSDASVPPNPFADPSELDYAGPEHFVDAAGPHAEVELEFAASLAGDAAESLAGELDGISSTGAVAAASASEAGVEASLEEELAEAEMKRFSNLLDRVALQISDLRVADAKLTSSLHAMDAVCARCDAVSESGASHTHGDGSETSSAPHAPAEA